MPTFLLAWNPANWTWTDQAQAAEQTEQGAKYATRWSCGNTKKIEPGDRLFLLKQGEPPRGIVASGRAASAPYPTAHWDAERAAKGEQTLFVNVEFDRILDPERLVPLSTDSFTDDLAEVHWAIQGSGVSVPDAAAAQLEEAWAAYSPSEIDPEPGEKKKRNPPWQRDELILALDLYVRFPLSTLSQTHPEVVALSEILNALPIHAERPDAEKFRNPNGVYKKLGNFASHDPDYKGAGLTRGNRLEPIIWAEFHGDHELLRETAEAIRRGHLTPEAALPGGELDSDDELVFPEGKVLYRLHRASERSRALVELAKERSLSKGHGRLLCEACTFDFEQRYGEVGKGFIECHHTTPLSAIGTETKTSVADLALVCSNCHRMLHRKRPWLTMTQLAQVLRDRSA